MSKMTKSQLLEKLATGAEISKKQAGAILDILVETAYQETKKAGEFAFPGLGKMVKKARAARQGRNPATGETINIPAKTVLKFRVSKQAKDAIL